MGQDLSVFHRLFGLSLMPRLGDFVPGFHCCYGFGYCLLLVSAEDLMNKQFWLWEHDEAWTSDSPQSYSTGDGFGSYRVFKSSTVVLTALPVTF